MCILCPQNDFWVCHAILDSTFKNKTTSKLSRIFEVLLYKTHDYTQITEQTVDKPSQFPQGQLRLTLLGIVQDQSGQTARRFVNSPNQFLRGAARLALQNLKRFGRTVPTFEQLSQNSNQDNSDQGNSDHGNSSQATGSNPTPQP